MYSSPCDNRGFSLLEAVIAIFLTTVALLAILSIQPMAWKASARSDYMGRAAGILYQELQKQQEQLANPCNAAPSLGTTTSTVNVSGNNTSIEPPGDAVFTVATTINPGATTNSWLVMIQVTWAGNANGIRGSLLAIQQETFRKGCP
ncbi:MAG: hypothetical protein CSYNP_00395 [Syntrophus sp. SKADARSKE-3]|nr:hypothetical protein [Syntrophus sp. SKADARSKE-3]